MEALVKLKEHTENEIAKSASGKYKRLPEEFLITERLPAQVNPLKPRSTNFKTKMIST